MIGVFDGSGSYDFLSDASPVGVSTPFGSPVAAVMVGSIGGTEVAFLPGDCRSGTPE